MRRRTYELAQQNPPRMIVKRKYTRQPEEIRMREPAPKFRLTQADVWRSPNGRSI